MLTPALLKRVYLRDMPLLDQYGRPLSDDLIATMIQATTAAFQRKHAIRLAPTLIKLGEGRFRNEAAFNPGGLPVERRDALDFDQRAFEGSRHARLTLPIGPVQRVLGVGLKLPGQAALYEFPVDVQDPNIGWAHVRKRRKRLSIYPGSRYVAGGHLMAIGAAALAGGATIPNGWQVVYEAGYSADDLAGPDADLLNALGKLVAVEVLVPGSVDLYLALGVSGLSASVDGLSNSTNLAGSGSELRYAPLIKAHTESIIAWEKTFSDRKSGPRVGFL